MRPGVGELERLSRELGKRADETRREVGEELPVLAGYRDAWEPVRRDVAYREEVLAKRKAGPGNGSAVRRAQPRKKVPAP
jgi:hypothetical protein